MTIDQTLKGVLEDTIKALNDLDLPKLHVLEQQIIVLAQSDATFDRGSINSVLLKKRQLEIILHNFRGNLDALTRLHARNTRNQWAQ